LRTTAVEGEPAAERRHLGGPLAALGAADRPRGRRRRGRIRQEKSDVAAGATYRLGIDIGGTFTDFVLYDLGGGGVATYKTLTTPDEPARAVIEGWRALLDRVGGAGRDVELVIHGTTLITNALIERKGARAALLTTEGFRDILDTQREMRYDIYDLHAPPVEPLIPRPLRVELEERIGALGQVLIPLTPERLAAATARLRALEPEAVGVCLLHAYRNPEHEQAARAWLADHLPGVAVSLSSEVAPEIREYERMSTVVANAYVQPLAARYLAALAEALRDNGYRRELFLMLSSGGITDAGTASAFPIRLVESGPAAGALAAVFYGRQTGHADLISFDMGGTTAKICVVRDHAPAMASTFEVARRHRFKRGSGLPVRVPAIELLEIGAGGGSIARVDGLGLLKVGPESAGADPGPACYGRGGTEPTVTDADLVLGYLNPANFLGGRMELDVAAAEAAIAALAARLGLDATAAAVGIRRVVDEAMIAATRVHLAERGVDPRRLWLLAFGGAGPVHADAIARALKLPGYLIPPGAGVTSALGFLAAPVAFDLARTHATVLTEDALPALDRVFAELAETGRATLARAGVPPEAMTFTTAADLRHRGQGHELTVALPPGAMAAVGLSRLREEFFARYTDVYGYAHRHLDLELMTCRLTASGGAPPLAPAAVAGGGAAEPTGTRAAFVAERGGLVPTPVYARAALTAGASFAGPALIEDVDSTIVIGPETTVVVDPTATLRVALHAAR
jgi:N-methylhydantoinase A/oxoprolinase/acetone carboxylase beta subunit